MGRRIPLALVLVLFVGVAACSDDSTETDATSETEATEATSESSPPATDASTTALPASTAPDTSTPESADPDGWDPILTTVQAGEAPPAATCPDGTDPNTPGPVDQDRPSPVRTGLRQATFDGHLGRIVFVDSANETWTFNVCTNTWTNMNPEGTIGVLQVVYDVDSDVTVGYGDDRIWVYDAAANAWSEHDVPSTNPPVLSFWPSAVYDPLSGLIIGTAGSGLAAFDVDTDTWTDVGASSQDLNLGYSVELDKLVQLGRRGYLLDPRTGNTQDLTPPTPDFAGGFGYIDYAADTDTPYVMDIVSKDICRFDPDTLGWQPCFDAAKGPVPPGSGGWGAMVGDPINNRLILINPQTGSGDIHGQDAVWAIDLDTGEWTEILAPSTTGIASTTRPWHTTESAHTDPADEFMDFIGFIDSATQGPFERGDSRSGEIAIVSYPDSPDPLSVTTTAFVRLDSEDNWVVTGSFSFGIDVGEPVPGESVSSPLDTHFTHSLISGGVVVQLWPDGEAEPIVDQFVTSGSGFFATVEWAPPTSGPATAIYTSNDCSDPACELPPAPIAVTAFRVELTN